MARSGVWRVCEDSKAGRRGLIVGGSGRRFGVQHSKSPSRLFPNTDNDVTGCVESRCLVGIEYGWQDILTLPGYWEDQK
jgi:hypothetical protein